MVDFKRFEPFRAALANLLNGIADRQIVSPETADAVIRSWSTPNPTVCSLPDLPSDGLHDIECVCGPRLMLSAIHMSTVTNGLLLEYHDTIDAGPADAEQMRLQLEANQRLDYIFKAMGMRIVFDESRDPGEVFPGRESVAVEATEIELGMPVEHQDIPGAIFQVDGPAYRVDASHDKRVALRRGAVQFMANIGCLRHPSGPIRLRVLFEE